MRSQEGSKFFDREFIFEMLRKEEQYSTGWGDGDGKDSVLEGLPDHAVSAATGSRTL